MEPEVLAVFIPIIFLVGLFIAISLNIYYKYKARVATADHAPGESIEQWYEADVRAKAAVSRTAALRLGGFLTGAGIGMVAGMFIGASPSVLSFFGSFCDTASCWRDEALQIILYVLFVMGCSLLAGGVGMICTWFLDRALDGKKQK